MQKYTSWEWIGMTAYKKVSKKKNTEEPEVNL